MEGIIIKNQSNDYTVRTSNGLYVCKPRGKFRNDKITPLVGDSVIIDDINNYLLEILPRKNSLIRPPIANIDIALIAVSVKEPNFDSNLLDKLLSSPKIIHYNQAITQKGNSIKFNNSLIKANYLLIKEIHNLRIHISQYPCMISICCSPS